MGEIEVSALKPSGHDSAAGRPAEGSSRRRFLKLAGGAGAATASATLVAACGSGAEPMTEVGAEQRQPVPGGDAGIVKYALTLEFFEEDFYEQVLDSGQISDGELLSLTELVYDNEKKHVETLSQLVEELAVTPPQRPKTDFDSVIDAGERKILETSAIFENLGAAAYLGQGANIQDPDILVAALEIHSVEARHAARFNELAGFGFLTGDDLRGSVPNGAFAKPMTMDQVLERVQPFVKT